jgi:hypothetical protein
MRRQLRSIVFATLVVAPSVLLTDRAVAQGDGVDDVLSRAARYAGAFIEQFSDIVAREDYLQEQAPSPGVPPRRRRLQSDFYFVRAAATDNWLVFRSVLVADGRNTPPTQERIVELLTMGPESSRQLADRVAAESARYYLADWPTLNSPLLGVFILQDQYRARFRFTVSEGRSGTTARRVITFEERARPTLFQDSGNLAMFGELQFDGGGERLIESAVRFSRTGTNTNVVAQIWTTFTRDERLGLDVPSQMRELYVAGQRRSSGTATYSSFRRFAVATEVTPQSQR